MEIFVRRGEIGRAGALGQHVEEQALRDDAARSTGVEVHLHDENRGQGGEPDQRCTMKARPGGADPVVVEGGASHFCLTATTLTSKLARAARQLVERSRRHRGGMRGPGRQLVVLGVVGAMLTAAGVVRAEEPADARVAAGMGLLSGRGCLACHSTDGTARVGPSLLGLYGSEIEVRGAAGSHRVRVDEPYLRRAIITPDAEARAGYPTSTMPIMSLDDHELDAVIAAIVDLGRPELFDQRRRDEGSMAMLIAGALLFVLGHLLLSSRPLRRHLVGRLGEKAFSGIYSLVALVGFGLLIWGWSRAPYVAVWTPALWTRYVPLVAMPIAFVFLVASFMTRNPTVYGQARHAAAGPQGIVTVTRHPMLWSYVLWGLAHVPPNGDVAALILLGAIISLGLAGMIHIDRRRAAAGDPGWPEFAAATSVVPFVAILRRRTRLDLRGILLPALLGLVSYVAMLFTHDLVIGVRALPYW